MADASPSAPRRGVPEAKNDSGGARERKLPWTRRWLRARGRSLEITKAGYIFIALTLGIGFAAINSGSNLLHVVFGVQLGVVVASGMLSERMVSRVRPRRVVTSPLYAGVAGALRVDLENTSRRGVLFSVSVEDDDRFERAGTTTPVFSLALPSRGQTSLHASVTLPQRGRHPLPPAVVSTRFPFGLFVKRKEISESGTVLVYPRIRDLPALAPGAALIGDGERSGRIARSGEFHGLDEYREGQSMRRIHWPASARRGRLVVREMEGDGDRSWVLELGRGRAGDPDFESAVEDVASRAVSALREGGIAVGLRIGDELVVAPGGGAGQERRILDVLATVGFERTKEFGTVATSPPHSSPLAEGALE